MSFTELCESDIRDWVRRNALDSMLDPRFTDAELDHISMCLHHISRWYHEGYPLGGFLTAVVRNDFSTACFKADGVNRKALYLYALFLANKIPGDYLEKARGGSTSAAVKTPIPTGWVSDDNMIGDNIVMSEDIVLGIHARQRGGRWQYALTKWWCQESTTIAVFEADRLEEVDK